MIKQEKRRKVVPKIENGQVKFITMRQELLSKPSQDTIKSQKLKKEVNQVAEISWGEPFILFYDDVCDEDPNAESQLKFTI